MAEEKVTAEDQKVFDEINSMSHADMCKLWRFAKAGHRFFDKSLPYHEVFRERLFNHFGGFTPEISKQIGWE